MKRNKKTKFKKASAILTGDWHLQESIPVARTDDFYNTQWGKLDFISDLQKKHSCPVFHSGDLFDYWKPSLSLISKTIEHLPKQFITIYGNHDLPQHNLELAHKCGIHVLWKAGKLNVFNGTHWGQKPGKNENGVDCSTFFEVEPPKSKAVAEDQCEVCGDMWGACMCEPPTYNIEILVWHTMTYQGKKPWPDCTDPKGSKLLRKYKNYGLILTGHNHIPFVESYKGRLLVNPGSIFRLAADQKEHKPRVYLWYSDTNTVKPVYLPIEKGVISDEHLTIKKERDDRIDAFISGLNTKWNVKMSFEDNIDAFNKKNKIKKSIMDIVYESLEY